MRGIPPDWVHFCTFSCDAVACKTKYPSYAQVFHIHRCQFPLFPRFAATISQSAKKAKAKLFQRHKEEKHSIRSAFRNWWEVVDSNHRSHRRQIYSLFPLATRETSHMKLSFAQKVWSWWTDLNPRPADYKSAALPTELHQRFASLVCLSDLYIIAYCFQPVNTFFDFYFPIFIFFPKASIESETCCKIVRNAPDNSG